MTTRIVSSPRLRICAQDQDETVLFAVRELSECLTRITGVETETVLPEDGSPASALCVGRMDCFPSLIPPGVADPRMDDAIAIHVTGGQGVIAGINPRSVLLAAYRYLTELGCRWVRPGKDGAFLPRLETLPEVHVEERPSCRHRAVCIEGSVSLDHVIDMVDWLPKLGFNGYFIQFREAYTFFDRWHSRVGRPEGKAMSLSVADAAGYVAAAEAEIRKRGLIYHKVGHGWTCEPFGISGRAWEKESAPLPPEVAPYLAEVNGKRELWDGIALNTNLCYSNPKVRAKIVNEIVSYAQNHPNVSLLHFWLADGSNNHCECPECRKARPADFYVMMLNAVDAALAARDLPARIVFLIYVDLLWPPETEWIRNPDRFVLMFAPIARTYSQSFRVMGQPPALPPFERNRLEFPRTIEANIAFLKAWQQLFSGDSFDFDYHLMWDHLNDPGHMHISRTIGEDMKALKAIGLNGFVSCQVQRVFLPTALPMIVMGRTLWNSQESFEDIARDYFASAFGHDAPACAEYLAKLSSLFDPVYARGEKNDEGAAARFAGIIEVIDAFLPVIERHAAAMDGCRQASWRYLKRHAGLCLGLARAYAAKASGDAERAASLWRGLAEQAWREEPAMHRVFDAWIFTEVLRHRFESLPPQTPS
ncbi:MAG TPA: DUF4838 domain-containing protein [Candidatus Hydrogenedentes bacterium]|nr:DUF4838 domain-containing protein [Candidatus Hydrogenedentota bacterium]HOS02955.1 DUF4838 domain-containing protein [Candidatus Hydrogenedentota bacterium]